MLNHTTLNRSVTEAADQFYSFVYFPHLHCWDGLVWNKMFSLRLSNQAASLLQFHFIFCYCLLALFKVGPKTWKLLKHIAKNVVTLAHECIMKIGITAQFPYAFGQIYYYQ